MDSTPGQIIREIYDGTIGWAREREPILGVWGYSVGSRGKAHKGAGAKSPGADKIKANIKEANLSITLEQISLNTNSLIPTETHA